MKSLSSVLLLLCMFFTVERSQAEITIASIAPTNVGRTSVKLNVTIDPSVNVTRLNFSYGTSATSLNVSTPQKTLSASSLAISTSEFISGLQCATQYFYRVSATNAGINTISTIGTFTTLGCVSVKAVIGTQEATNISETSALFKGNISLEKSYAQVSYYFEYGPNTSYGELKEGGFIGDKALQVDVDDDVFNLSCGRTYHYRLVVRLKETEASEVVLNEGNDMAFATVDCPTPMFLGVSFVAASSDTATLEAIFNSQGQELGVYFQWGETSELGQQTEVIVGLSTVLQKISGLDCGIPYYYAAVLKTETEEIVSEVQKFSTKACSQPPIAETFSAEEISKNTAKISASVSPNEASTSVYFEWGLSGVFGNTTEPKTINGGFAGEIVSQELTGLTCATQYFYRVVAANLNGQINGQSLSFTTASCDAPNPGPAPNLVSAKIFSGSNHTIALGQSGEVITWGDNRLFQLGGVTDEINLVDGVVKEATENESPLLFNIVDAAAGGEHSLILHESGAVLSFGNNGAGQLGAFSDNVPAQLPIFVVDESGSAVTNIVDVAAGKKHSVGLRSDGSILLWGDNSFGQLAVEGLPSSIKPMLMTTINNAIQVAAGENYNLAVLLDKSLVAWGANGSGQLGIGGTNQTQEVTIVLGATDIKSLAAGSEHVLALQQDGTVLVWGNNQSGQLGIGNTENQHSPVELSITEAGNIVQLAAGNNHSVALLDDGSLLAWGDNAFGQLGGITSQSILSPTEVVGSIQEPVTNIVSIAAGTNFTVAVDNKGHILSWGDNSLGQLNGKASTNTQLLTLSDKFDTDISLNMPRIILDKAELKIVRGSLGRINVRLSSSPDEAIMVEAKFSSGAEGFFIERNSKSLFSDVNENWAYEKTLNISLVENSGINEGVLSFSAPGFATVDVPVMITKGVVTKPKEQVVGALPAGFIFLLFSWQIIVRLWRVKHA